MTKKETAMDYFKQGYNCSQAVALAFSEEVGIDKKTLAMMASGFGGGFGRSREVCGAVSGMVMILSMLKGYSDAKASAEKAELYKRVQALMGEFKEINGSYICRELIGSGDKAISPIPADRNSEFYKKRPCVELVGCAAELLEKELES